MCRICVGRVLEVSDYCQIALGLQTDRNGISRTPPMNMVDRHWAAIGLSSDYPDQWWVSIGCFEKTGNRKKRDVGWISIGTHRNPGFFCKIGIRWASDWDPMVSGMGVLTEHYNNAKQPMHWTDSRRGWEDYAHTIHTAWVRNPFVAFLVIFLLIFFFFTL